MSSLLDAAEETVQELGQQHGARAAQKEEHAEQVLELISSKIDEIQAIEKAEEVVDPMSDNGEDLTATELERDSALRDTELTKKRLAQFQEEAAKNSSAPPQATAPRAGIVHHKFLDRTAVIQRDDLPIPLPDVGNLSPECEAMLWEIHKFYTVRQFAVLPPTSLEDISADTELLDALLGEKTWQAFFASDAIEPQEALPAQLHSIIAYQAKLAAQRLAKGKGTRKGKDKDNKDNTHNTKPMVAHRHNRRSHGCPPSCARVQREQHASSAPTTSQLTEL